MAIRLKAADELIVGATAITLVFAIFGNGVPNFADIRADQPGNPNTHKSTKMAAITATAAVGSLALIAKSPTVFIIGGATILFETWKYHAANYGANGTQETSAAQAGGING
jgi:hypothetical protein